MLLQEVSARILLFLYRIDAHAAFFSNFGTPFHYLTIEQLHHSSFVEIDRTVSLPDPRTCYGVHQMSFGPTTVRSAPRLQAPPLRPHAAGHALAVPANRGRPTGAFLLTLVM